MSGDIQILKHKRCPYTATPRYKKNIDFRLYTTSIIFKAKSTPDYDQQLKLMPNPSKGSHI
jgi:hypothetical protein